VDFIIRNQVDNIVLKHGIYHVSKGGKDGKSSTEILLMSETSVKVKASLLSAASIKCCLVYELIDQRNENESVMENHQLFIAISMFARPHVSGCKVSAIMFVAENGRFTGKEGDIKRLKEGILREHLVDNTCSFECAIKTQTLRLDAVFHPSKANIEVTLKEIIRHTDKKPVILSESFWVNK
jgi:hypothetical protein